MIEQTSKPFLAFSLPIIICISLVACGRFSQPESNNNGNLAETVQEPVQEMADAGDAVEAGDGSSIAEPNSTPEVADSGTQEPAGQLLIWAPEADQDVWENTVLAEFQEKYPLVEIEIENYPLEEVAPKIGIARRVSRPIPDLAVSRYRDAQALISRGDLMEVTSLIEPHKDKFNPQILNYCADGDAYFCVPWHVGPTVLFYRRDIFEAAGFPSDPESVNELVATWGDYLRTCRMIRSRTAVQCMPYIYRSLMIDIMWQRGFGFFDQEGELNIDDPQVISVLEVLREFRDARIIRRRNGGLEGWQNDLTAHLDNKDTPPVATVVYPSWLGHSLKNLFETKQAGNWGMTLLPAWEEGGGRTSFGGGSAYIIPNESSNPDAARAFIELMALHEENLLEQFAYSDYMPALNTTYDDPLFSEGDPFFADQKTRLLFLEVMNNIPDPQIFGTKYYSDIINEIDIAVHNYFTDQMDAQQALQDAAQTLRLKLEAR